QLAERASCRFDREEIRFHCRSRDKSGTNRGKVHNERRRAISLHPGIAALERGMGSCGQGGENVLRVKCIFDPLQKVCRYFRRRRRRSAAAVKNDAVASARNKW